MITGGQTALTVGAIQRIAESANFAAHLRPALDAASVSGAAGDTFAQMMLDYVSGYTRSDKAAGQDTALETGQAEQDLGTLLADFHFAAAKMDTAQGRA